MNIVLDSLDSFELAGNSVLSWALPTAVVLGLYLVLSALLRFLRRNMHRFSKSTSTVVDDILVAVLGSTKPLILFVVSLWAGTRFLELGQAEAIPRIVLLIVVMVFGTKKLKNMGSDLGGAVKGFKDGMKEGGT